MYVVIRIKPDSMCEGPHLVPGEIPADLRDAASRLGINIQPMHPGVTDPTLASYFYVETPDQPTADRVIGQLQQLKSVEAAFLKPPEGPP